MDISRNITMLRQNGNILTSAQGRRNAFPNESNTINSVWLFCENNWRLNGLYDSISVSSTTTDGLILVTNCK